MAEISTPINYRLVINRGGNLQLAGTYKDEDGVTPIDLTGCVGYFAIGYKYQDLVDLMDDNDTTGILFHTSSADSENYIVLGDAEGTFVIDIDWDEFMDISPTGEGYDYENYWWWFVIEYTDGTREIMFYGPCEVI